MNRAALAELSPSSGVDAQNPWPGLVTFTEELRGFFHGRDEETDELLRRVQRKNLTVLFGQSGLGKSSLLQAGLFPRLRAEGYLPVPIRLDHAASAPALSAQVKAAVARAIVDTGGLSEAAAPDASETLWEHFHRRGLRQQTRDGRPVRLVLVFDQFEELFAIGHASEETRARAAVFLAEMADLIENRAPQVLERRLEDNPELVKQFLFDDQDFQVLVCFREDYLPHLESLRQSMPSLAENRMRLTRMHGARALEAVTGPGGDLITPEVARQVVRFVAGGEKREQLREMNPLDAQREDETLAKMEIEPSLLSLVCRELNNRRLALGQPQITAYLLAGNRERILQDYYERCVADQPPEVRAFIEDELVTDSGLRENMALERARRTLIQRGAPASAIDELVKRRLLHLEERLDIQRVELTHDVLTPVVKKSRDQRQQQEATLRAEQHAQEVREKARRQRRRLRFIVGAMAAALLVVGGFGVASYRLYRVSAERLREVEKQKREAERQKERAEKGEQEASQARAEAVKEKERAEGNQKLADRSFDDQRGLVDELMTEMSQEGLKDMPGLQQLRQRYAQKAADRYEVYMARRPGDLGVTDGQARSLTALGTITGQVGSVAKAVATLEQAIRIREGLVAREPANPEYQLQLARARVELGDLYRSSDQKQKAQPHLKRAIVELDTVIGKQRENVIYRLLLARAYNLLGNVTRDGKTNILSRDYYERARMIAEELCAKHPDDPECLKHLAPPIGNLAELSKHDGNYNKALELEDKFLELTEEILKRFPRSPNLLVNRGIGYEDKADLLMKLKRPNETTKCIRNALDSYRVAAKENPLVSRNQWMLAEGLRNLARHLSSRNQYEEAKALYEESCEVLEALTQSVDDRPAYGTALIESWAALAEFHAGGKGDKADEATRKKGQLRCLEQALQHGRNLSRKFPNDPKLHFQIAEALFRRAIYDTAPTRNKQAYPFFEECVETFRTRVYAGDYKPTDYELGQFLMWTLSAQECAQGLKREDEVMRLANVAYNLGRGCANRDGISSLATTINKSASIHKEAGRYKDSIEAYSRALGIIKSSLEKSPWHWWLRQNVAGEYMNIAQCYRQLGDFHNEVLAWREFLKVWSGPMQGMKIDDYIDVGRPTDEPEAVRLRQFFTSSSADSLKRFTVSAEFNGMTYPFAVYLTNVPWPKDPLEDQARWLQEERGGMIPEEDRERFRTLHKAAHQNKVDFLQLCLLHEIARVNKVSFPDLCTYALGTRFKETWKAEELAGNKRKFSEKFKSLERLHNIAKENKVNFRDLCTYALNITFKESRAEPEELAKDKKKFQAEVTSLTDRVKKEPEKADLQLALGQAFERLGDVQDSLHETKEAIQSFERSRRLYELLFWKPTNSVAVFMGLGDVCSKLGGLYIRSDIKEMEKAYALYQRSVAIFDQLTARPQANPEWHKKKAQALRQLGSLCGQFFSPAEGVRWYSKAMNQNDEVAAQELAALYREYPELPKVFPSITRKLLELLVGRAKKDLVTLPNAAHVEALFQFAEWYEKGINVEADPNKADHCRYLASYVRGWHSFHEKRYEDALPDLKRVCELKEADSDDHDRLGNCCRKLHHRDEAIKAFTRSIELEPKGERASGTICNLLEALIVAERPEQLLQFVQGVEKKGWKLPTTGSEATKYNALFHGFQAIALHMSGKDASEAQRLMRQFSGKPGSKISWGWDEMDQWLKSTKLAPERKASVQKIVGELRGTTSR